MSKNTVSLKNCSLDRLLNFAAVVRKGGIVGVTGGDPSRQALISRQISELASHFEAELTRRSGKGLAFTPAGEQLARLVTELENGLEELRAGVRGAPVGYSIAASNSVLYWLVLPKLRAISDALPAVKWTLHHESTAGICEKVTMGQIDFGICIGTPTAGSLKRRFLGDVAYSLFVPSNLGNATDPAEILREVPLALPIGGTLRASIAAWAKKAKINLNVRLEVDSYLQAADAVVRGTHAAVLPSLAAATMSKDVRVLPLPATVAQRRKLWLVWTSRLLRTRNAAERVRDTLVRCVTG
jgi:DNA-binding transcriptional LysR family regulator